MGSVVREEVCQCYLPQRYYLAIAEKQFDSDLH